MCVAVTVANRGPDEADPARAAHAVVPQHLVLGAARARPGAAIAGRQRRPAGRPAPGARRARPGRRRRRRPRCSATTRPTRSGCGACPARSLYPKDGINDHVVAGAPTVNPAGDRHQGRAALRARRAGPRGDRQIRLRLAQTEPPPAPRRAGRWTSAPASTRSWRDRAGRGGRVLRRADPGRRLRRRGRRRPAGDRRADVGQAVLPLRRAAVARRRPGVRATAAGPPATGATTPGGT